MRAFVFTDEALGRQAGRFVWLSINTEKRENAGVLAKYPVKVWPSFFVIDPKTEKIALRLVGGAATPQLLKVLDDGENAIRGGGRGGDEALAKADRLFGDGRNEEAIKAYQDLLAHAKAGWRPYARVTESLLFALSSSQRNAECVALARTAYPKLSSTPSAANVAGSGLDCAMGLSEKDASRAEQIAEFAAFCRDLVAAPRADLAADDVSSVYDTLAQERAEAKDPKGQKKILAAWATYLENQAAAARSPEERTVFDSHRVSAYLALEQPERALPMLDASERDFPADYNPPARLAVAYRALKRWDDALAASARALEKAYGPRKLGIYQTRADVFSKKGDAVAARKTLEDAIAYGEALPAEHRSENAMASLRKKLESLDSRTP